MKRVFTIAALTICLTGLSVAQDGTKKKAKKKESTKSVKTNEKEADGSRKAVKADKVDMKN